MHTIFPGAAIIQGIFPSQTTSGRICLLENLIKGSGDFLESEAYKLLLFHLFFPLLNISIIIYLRLRVRRFMGDLCPRKQMSCIGVYKRNVISLKTTIVWLIIWDVSALIDCGFQALLSMEPSQVWSREVVFWIWNIKGFLFNEGLHLTLPSFLEIPNSFERQKVRVRVFYARHPGSLEPRRESGEIGTNPQNARKEDKGTQQQKEQPNSLLLGARELLLVKVPARLIKVAEYKAEYKHKNKYENKAEYVGPARWQDWSKYAVTSNHGLSTTEKEGLRRNRLELSIPESYVDEHLGDHGEHYGVDHCDQRLTTYCRKHKSFASHLYT